MPKQPTPMPESQVTPDPKLEKRTRRTFKPEYKLRIIQEADACKHGELGALHRREKLYSNQLSDWRREYAQSGLAGLTKSSPGPAPERSVEQREIEKLKRQVTKCIFRRNVNTHCVPQQCGIECQDDIRDVRKATKEMEG